jgi:hypothetical protein
MRCHIEPGVLDIATAADESVRRSRAIAIARGERNGPAHFVARGERASEFDVL